MKKLFLIIAVALSTILIACANEQVINVEQLPAKAQSLIQTHFSAESVSYVLQERDGLSMEYEVRFDSGSKVEFDSKGEIKKIVCEILEANPQSVADFKAGKDRALGFLVGQAMKATKGKANPQMLNKMFVEEMNK